MPAASDTSTGEKVTRTLRFAVSGLSPSSHAKLDDVFALMNDLYNALVEEHRARLREWRRWKMGDGGRDSAEPADREWLTLTDRHGVERRVRPGASARKPVFGSFYDNCKTLTSLRNDPLMPELAAVSLLIQRGELKKFDDNCSRRFKVPGSGASRFRSYRRHRSLSLSPGVDESRRMLQTPSNGGRWHRLRVKGMPTLKFETRGRLKAEHVVKVIRIVRRERRYEVHLVVEEQIELPRHDGPDVGIDVGVTVRVTCSDGHTVERRRQDTSRTERLQRSLSRATAGSNSWKKKRKALAREHERVREREAAADHEITTALARTYRNIAVEDLDIQAVLKDASKKGDLSRHIARQAWGRLTQQLTYKAESAGGSVVRVDPKFTSQDCSYCETQRSNWSSRYSTFLCASCGAEADRDVNAARNVYLRATRSDTGGKTPWRAVEADNPGLLRVRAEHSQHYETSP